MNPLALLDEHRRVTRRFLLQSAAAGSAVSWLSSALGQIPESSPELADAIARLESYFTPPAEFRDVSRGDPLPHSLPEEKKREVGLARETWRLEVIADPENPASLKSPLTKAEGTALDFAGLLEIAQTRAVKFAKVMTCLNIGCPLGMGVWEGVPLREIVWRTGPRENLRRVFYHGYHNDDPAQMFRSSLPIDRVLEDPFDLPPVILCYKLNGQWLDSQRGGPVRIVVPEGYGFKSIKWLTHVVLSNRHNANDTYADGNNDVDSALKSFAATLSVPKTARAGQPIAVTGYAQVGISGLSKVQVSVLPEDHEAEPGDPYFDRASWLDAQILPPPEKWGGDFPEDEPPLEQVIGFNADGRPNSWPMRLAKAHWAILLPGLPVGDYTLRSRTIDAKGVAQPLPRPFRKSGHAAIEEIAIKVG
jgi:DMSO/TMAO reductase YedYZ molybdopterin-dependent catalytic subunit